MIKNNKGVTLVELLIVIVILGIIAAISIPAVGNIVSNAQKDAVLADALNARSQAVLYCQQNIGSDVCTGDAVFTSEGDVTDGVDIDLTDGYLDSFDYDYYLWFNGTTWLIAISDGDMGFVGNPQDATRAWLDDEDDNFWNGVEEPDWTIFDEPTGD